MHPVKRRVRAAAKTRKPLEDLSSGRSGGESERSDQVKRATRLIVEAALESEVADKLGRGYSAYGIIATDARQGGSAWWRILSQEPAPALPRPQDPQAREQGARAGLARGQSPCAGGRLGCRPDARAARWRGVREALRAGTALGEGVHCASAHADRAPSRCAHQRSARATLWRGAAADQDHPACLWRACGAQAEVRGTDPRELDLASCRDQRVRVAADR